MITVLNYVVIPALIGPLLGPFVGGVIVHWVHWRAIFFINLPLGLLGLWLARRYMPDYREADTPPLDWRGFVLFGTACCSLVRSRGTGQSLAAGSRSPSSCLRSRACCSAQYGWHAMRVPAPLLALRLLRIRTFRVSVLGGFVTRLGVGGMPFLLPLLYQVGLGYLPWQAGLLTMPQAASAIGMKFVGKPLLERYGHRAVLRVNTVMMGACIATFALVGPGTPVYAIVGLSLLQGLASSTQFTSMNSLVYADVSDAEASRAGSIASTAQQLALSFGVALDR
jgi:MFS family permease